MENDPVADEIHAKALLRRFGVSTENLDRALAEFGAAAAEAGKSMREFVEIAEEVLAREAQKIEQFEWGSINMGEAVKLQAQKRASLTRQERRKYRVKAPRRAFRV